MMNKDSSLVIVKLMWNDNVHMSQNWYYCDELAVVWSYDMTARNVWKGRFSVTTCLTIFELLWNLKTRDIRHAMLVSILYCHQVYIGNADMKFRTSGLWCISSGWWGLVEFRTWRGHKIISGSKEFILLHDAVYCICNFQWYTFF
jgi:hypothetical protein